MATIARRDRTRLIQLGRALVLLALASIAAVIWLLVPVRPAPLGPQHLPSPAPQRPPSPAVSILPAPEPR